MSDDQKNPSDGEKTAAQEDELHEPLLSDDDLVKLMERDFANQEGEVVTDDELAQQRVWQNIHQRIQGRTEPKLIVPGLLALAAAVILIVYLGGRIDQDQTEKSAGEIAYPFTMTPMMIDEEGDVAILPSAEPPAEVSLVLSVRPGADGFVAVLATRQANTDVLLSEVAVSAHSDELLGDGENAYVFRQPESDPYTHLCVVGSADREQLSAAIADFRRDPVRGISNAQSKCLHLSSGL